MSGINGCYSCNPCIQNDYSPLQVSSCKSSWFLPVLLIFVAVLCTGGLSLLLILLGIILFFGKALIELIF